MKKIILMSGGGLGVGSSATATPFHIGEMHYMLLFHIGFIKKYMFLYSGQECCHVYSASPQHKTGPTYTSI